MRSWMGCVCIVVLSWSTARAQHVGVGGSYVFVDELDDVYGVAGHLHVPIQGSLYLSLRGASYQNVERTSTLGPVGIFITADYVPVDLGVGWSTLLGEGSWTVYAEGGVSYVFVESDIDLNGVPTDVEIENDYGWYLTAGLRMGTGSWQGFAEAQLRTFTWSVDEDSLPPGLPTPEEIDLDHIALNVGIVYEW